MDRQTKLDVLQKELSRKDLDTWCEVYSKAYHKRMTIAYVFTAGWRKYWRILGESNKDTLYIEYLWYHWDISEKDISKVYGHKVILSDVLVWLWNNKYSARIDTMWYIMISKLWNMFTIYRDLTKPYLSEQDDTVVDGLYEVFLLTTQNK